MIFYKLRTLSIIFIVAFIQACASGSSIVTGKVRAPIDSSQVKLYIDTPENYETIGLVMAKSGAGATKQGSLDYAVEELKKQAAKLGANGVLLITSGESTSSVVGTNSNGTAYAIPTSAQTVSGKAIYIYE